jgi:hypothetical protein
VDGTLKVVRSVVREECGGWGGDRKDKVGRNHMLSSLEQA